MVMGGEQFLFPIGPWLSLLGLTTPERIGRRVNRGPGRATVMRSVQ